MEIVNRHAGRARSPAGLLVKRAGATELVHADARQAEIRLVAQEMLGRRIPFLYEGSLYPQNCEELIACPHVDGLFTGRSAWDVEGYLDIFAKCGSKISRSKS